eukprot:781769-Pyramimonas_sp.AAC.1
MYHDKLRAEAAHAGFPDILFRRFAAGRPPWLHKQASGGQRDGHRGVFVRHISHDADAPGVPQEGRCSCAHTCLEE